MAGAGAALLLLVGDASYDYRGFLPNSTPNFVPTYLLATHFVGETASDNWFVSLGAEDDRPDMAVGRIPAQTPQQVADVVAKTLAYERDTSAGNWADKALFVADDKESNFQTIADDLASTYLPKDYQVEKIYLGKSENPHAELMQSLEDGVGLVTYVGHGSMNVLAQEKILQTDDVAKLDNQALPFHDDHDLSGRILPSSPGYEPGRRTALQFEWGCRGGTGADQRVASERSE